jgi:uncharacterized phiE125 gp8 family phage protein
MILVETKKNKFSNYKLITPAANEPLDLTEVKDYLRITGTDFDTQLTDLIIAVREYAEFVTGRDLINKTWRGFLDNFYSCYCCDNSIEVRKSKLQSITSIQYYKNGVLTTFNSSNYYFTDSNDYSSIYLVDGASYPDDVDNRKQAIIINFVAGYGSTSASVPQLLKQAMLSQIASLFDNLGDCAENNMTQFSYLYKSFIIGSNFLRVV